jgi:hypothetical protein
VIGSAAVRRPVALLQALQRYQVLAIENLDQALHGFLGIARAVRR